MSGNDYPLNKKFITNSETNQLQDKNKDYVKACDFLKNKLINIVLFEKDTALEHLNNVDKLTNLICEVEKNCTFLTETATTK